ncbi:hypothetical protein [Nocardia wallacei]|uniref:hypothetical protein n=1 Tax=Nocardia wallacei TaxID=480035 RepID=UPI002456A948|nr:hypothetical protein [Nocardia wallacei]
MIAATAVLAGIAAGVGFAAAIATAGPDYRDCGMKDAWVLGLGTEGGMDCDTAQRAATDIHTVLGPWTKRMSMGGCSSVATRSEPCFDRGCVSADASNKRLLVRVRIAGLAGRDKE